MALFEAPLAHEATQFSSIPEASFEWETHGASHFSPENLEAWESSPEAWESSPEAWENPEAWESSPEAWESSPEAWESSPEAWESSPEAWENPEAWETLEADRFLGGLARRLGGLARRMAPRIFRSLAGMIPGVGPMVSQVLGSVMGEAEAELEHMEANLFGSAEGELPGHEMAHEAALTEMLAAEAANASTEAEAASVIAATLPITIRIMGGRRALRPALPAMAQANGKLVRTLGRQGPQGRQLLRAVPAIQRQAVATLRAANRRGQPVTGPMAVGALAAASRRLLSDPRRVTIVINRNAAIRRRVAPMSPRRSAVFVPGRMAPAHPRRRPARPMTYRRFGY